MKYLAAIFILFVFTINVSAQTGGDTVQISLNQLIESGIKTNSKLEPVELARKIELIKSEQNNKQPMPMFEFMLDYIPLDFMTKPEYGAFYSQRLMLPGKLEQNELSGQVKSRRQEIEKDRIRIDITRQIKLNYYALYYYEKLLLFNDEYQKIMKNIIKSLEASYASGMGNQSGILKMNNELQMMVLEQIEFEQTKKTYINNLSLYSNISLPENFKTENINPSLLYSADLDSSKLAGIIIANNPEFRLIDNMLEETRIQRNIAGLEKVPDITLTGGVKYMAKEPMSYLSFTIGIDLPFMPWNARKINSMIEETNVMELQSLSMRKSALQYMKSELQNMLIMIRSVNQKIQYIRDIFIPQVRQTFNSSLASYSSGAGEFMNLLDSFRKMREADMMLIKEETDLLKQTGELEFLLGKQITVNNQ
jgi:outer membrane protein TolC